MNGLNFDRINPQFNSKLRQLSAYYFKRGIKWSKRISDSVNGRESFKYPSNFFVCKKIWEDKNGYLKRNGSFWEADSFHCIQLFFDNRNHIKLLDDGILIVLTQRYDKNEANVYSNAEASLEIRSKWIIIS